MNLRRLESFLATAYTGSVSAAARKLGIGQPAVSKHLIALEKDFGVDLFTRKSDPAGLTVAGQRLLPIAREIVQSLINAQTLLRRYK